jgi:glycosyltransferase involved in cell wall biosynthesis
MVPRSGTEDARPRHEPKEDGTDRSGLRVALLSPRFWPEVRRGGERFVRELADGLIARGHRPRLITSHPGLPSRAVEGGLTVVRNWRPPDAALQRRGWEGFLTHVPFSYLSLRWGDDDLAQAVYPTDALAAAHWSKHVGRPSILSFLGIPDPRWLPERRLRFETLIWALRGCTALTVLSRAAAEAFHRSLGIDPWVIPPAVNVRAFMPGGERSEEPTVFCAAAVEDPMKRVELLLGAFEMVRRQRPRARLLLSRPHDAGLAQELAASEGVELVDVDRHEALLETYRKSWVSVLPSDGDAFGLVLAEALACGTPVVGSNLGGVPDVIDREEVGRLFEGADVQGLACALLETLELAQDPATASACRARAEEFSTERCAEAYEELYQELLTWY